MCRVVCRNGKYNCVLQNCIVTKITVVKTEEHVMKTSIINTSATVSLALPADTVKQVSSSVALLMCTLVGASIVAPFALKRILTSILECRFQVLLLRSFQPAAK